MKDSRGAWGSLPQAAAACYPYDPSTLAAYGPYGDRYGSIDNAARRKNATRETTNTLKAWLYEHRKNPYPTKGEKIMLAIITKMTLTQVSTWFANARRRLKKENKMTWEPRNKTSDSADGDDKSDNGSGDEDDRPISLQNDKKRHLSDIKQENDEDDTRDSHFKMGCMDSPDNSSGSESRSPSLQCMRGGLRPTSPDLGLPGPGSDRPKIWSLAHTATSDSPPPIRRSSPAPRTNDPYDVKTDDGYGSSELSLRNVMYREDVKPMMGELNGVHGKTWMNGSHHGNKAYTGVDVGQRCSPPKAAFGSQTFSERRTSYCDMLGGSRQHGYGVAMNRQPPPPLIQMNYNRDDDILQSAAKTTNAIGACAMDKTDTGGLSERKLYSSSVSPGQSPVGVPALQASLSPPSNMHGTQTAFKPISARNSCSEPPTV